MEIWQLDMSAVLTLIFWAYISPAPDKSKSDIWTFELAGKRAQSATFDVFDELAIAAPS